MRIYTHCIRILTVTLACKVPQSDDSEPTVENGCLEQLNKKLMRKVVFASQKKVVGRLTSSVLSYFLVCAASPSNWIIAFCQSCQEKLASFVLEEVLRYKTGTIEQSIPSPTTELPNLDIADACLYFRPLVLSSRREHCTLSISSHANVLAAIITGELATEPWSPVVPTESSKSDVLIALTISPALIKNS